MRIRNLILGSVLVAAATVLPMALSQDHAGHEKRAEAVQDQPAPSGMTGGMGQMKLSGPVQMRCRMMMNMEVKSDDPAALLALKDGLKLTEEQTSRLKALVAQAREQAAKVLTDEQKKQLEPLAKTPDTMLQMHQQMMQRMQQSQEGKDAGMGEMPMCPMMQPKGATQDHSHHQH